MSGNATVQVEVLALVADFKSQMASAAVAMNSAVKKMGGDLGELGGEAKKAGGHVSGLTGFLQHHRKEMRAEAGMTKVLARDLAVLGLDAKGAGGEIAHLIGAFAIGGGIGVAFAAVKLVAGFFKELGAEAEAAREAAKKWSEELAKGAAASAAELQKVLDKLNQVTPIQAVARQKAGVDKQLADQRAYVESLKEDAESLSAGNFYNSIGVRIDADTLDNLERAEKDLRALEETSRNLGATGQAMFGADVREEMKSRGEAARKAREAAAAEREKEAFESASSLSKRLQGEEKENERYWENSARLRAHWAQVGVDEETKVVLESYAALDQLRADDTVAREAVMDGLARKLEEIREKNRAQMVAEKMWVDQWSDNIGRHFGRAFSGMLLEAQSFGDAIAGLFKSLADAVIQEIARMAASWLAMTALRGLAALFSFGGSEVVGAGGIMGSALSGGSGLTMQAFAGGGDFGGFEPFLVGERGPEIVAPRGASGTVIPNSSLGGGGTIVVNVNAIDSRSFDGYLRSGGDSVLIKALDRARSQGRYR